MNLSDLHRWSNINMNAAKLSDKLMEIDMMKKRVVGPNSDLLVDPSDLKEVKSNSGFLLKVRKFFGRLVDR